MPYSLSITTRTSLKKRSKDVLLKGMIPGVIYGHGIEPRPIQVGRLDFSRIYKTAGSSALIDLKIDEAQSVKALIQDVQPHMITLEPAHVDFRQIRMDEPIVVEVPLKFIGESAAVKSLAGTLVTPKTSLNVKCLPADLPHEIEVDLSILKTFDDAVSVATLNLPKGVVVLDDARETLAVVAAPLTEDQLKKLDEEGVGDVSAVKSEAEEKKAAEAAKKAEEDAAAAAAK